MSQNSNNSNDSVLYLGDSVVWHRETYAVYSIMLNRNIQDGVHGLYLEAFFDMSREFRRNNVYDVNIDSFDAESIEELSSFYVADWTGNGADEFNLNQFIEHMQMVREISNQDRIARAYTNHSY
jgi:hypothetical protein